MKHLLLTLAFFVFAVPVFAQSSYVNIYSTVSYNSGTNIVTAQSYTQPSYTNAMYYNTGVSGYIRNSDGTQLAFQSANGGTGQATINLSATGNGCDYYQATAGHWHTMTYWVSNYYYNGSYYTGYWDYYNYYNSFNGDSDGGSPYYSSFSYFGPGPQYSTYSTYVLFGGTEEWTQGACTTEPTATITDFTAVGKGKTTKAYVSNPSNVTITLSLAPKKGQSGSAKFTSTGTATRTISTSGEVEIEGVTQSNTKDSMQLKAMYATPGGGNVRLDTEDFTVIQVTLSIKNSGTISTDNDKSANTSVFIGTTTLGGPRLSNGTAAHIFRNLVEIKAAVLPTNFNETLWVKRQIVETRTHSDETLGARAFTCSDTSDDLLLDKTVSSNGNAYDIDGPGLLVGISPPDGTIYRVRTNFKQWVEFEQNYSNSGLTWVVVSDDFTWYNRISVEKVNSTTQVVNTDVTGDNSAGAGASGLDWNLSGTTSSSLNTGCPA